MDPAHQSSAHLRFGVFDADLRLGVLTKQGKRVPLQEQPFRVLAMLLQRRGDLVSREELRAHLWPDTVVDFDHGLNKAINKIRDILGDSASNPRFIETVARRGYRFLAEVSVVDPSESRPSSDPEISPPVSDPVAVSFPANRRRWALVAPGIFLLLLVALFVLEGRQPPQPVRSLAVLPLANLTGDSTQEYFADGMTDELITQLAQIGTLRVISRSSVMAYKKAPKPLAQIARELDVQAVVEGSVMTSGQRVRITAQLIRVPADEHIWAKSYEGDLRDSLRLQSEVAQAVATQIRATLSPRERAALQTSRTVDPTAYEAYLKGRFFWNKRTAPGLRSAIEYFNTSIETDPDYAPAYAGLADSYALAGDWEYGLLSPQEAWPRSESAARKALSLDHGLSAAHASLAFALDLYTWDWSTAEAEFRQAIALSPSYATAHHWYGFHLLTTGRNREGLEELRKAESLDPLSLIISSDIADALCIARLYDQAIEQSHKTLSMDANFALAYYELGQALEQKRLHDQAIEQFRRAISLAGHSAAFESNLAHAYARSGRRSEALQILKELQARSDQYPAAYASIALVYVGLGDADSAMAWLEKAYLAHVNPSILLRPVFDPLRTDARFRSLLAQMGLQ